MNSLLDVIGSSIIGGIMYLLLFQVNSQISMTSIEILQSTFSSRNTVDAVTVLEYDLNKLGYRVAGDFITAAEENKIEFWSDIKNEDSTVKVLYFLGDSTEVSGTINPNDRPLYRRVADGDTQMVSVVRDFKITYLDSAYNKISFASLNNQTNRNKISGTRVYLRIESSEPSEGIYPYIEFKRTIIPKNLGRII